MVFDAFKETVAKAIFTKNGVLPSNFYIGLSTSIPTSDGNNVGEPSTSYGYKRQLLSLEDDLGTKGVVKNSNPVDFGAAKNSWGTINSIIIFDSVSGGNPLLSEALSSPITVAAQDSVKISAGDAKLYVGDVK